VKKQRKHYPPEDCEGLNFRMADNTPGDEPILASLVITRFFDSYDFDVGSHRAKLIDSAALHP
jgi:hypothetical protein